MRTATPIPRTRAPWTNVPSIRSLCTAPCQRLGPPAGHVAIPSAIASPPATPWLSLPSWITMKRMTTSPISRLRSSGVSWNGPPTPRLPSGLEHGVVELGDVAS